ncbi:MAG: SIR2 family protein [Oceanospirillales bacterium]|nr:SIR2 family protein [Oceanospirillales bacterium]PHS76527.1 MAG: SIR2 family protein [Porticoccus sp.]
MDLEEISRLAQECFQGCPTIILGSGASMPHGLPSMGALSTYLMDNIDTEGDVEDDAWLLLRHALSQGDHLEAALEGKTLPPSLLNKILRCTWECVNEKDQAVFASSADGTQTFPLGRLLRELINSTQRELNIVTTNYDRVAEFACNSVGIMFQTGFAPGYVQKWESTGRVQFKHGHKASRIVKIWKVHGSLDWFQTEGHRTIGLPVFSMPDEKLAPLIVTPGLNKYEKTSEEPFRTTINGADTALKSAQAFFCVGFGFRDKHIHPKIIEQCMERNVPIVVLAQKLTNEAKQFLQEQAGNKYLGIEQHAQGNYIYTSKQPDGMLLQGKGIWSLRDFNELIL